jgi:uncharacterized protein DUF1552
MRPFRLSRRTVLRAAGISIALPTLDAMLDRRGRWLGLAQAQTAVAPPVRVMAFHFPHGVILTQPDPSTLLPPQSLPPLWTPTTAGTGYTMTAGLMPIAAYQDDVNVITGLKQLAWNKGPGGGHANGIPNFATAVVSNAQGAGGPSFDQVLAAELGAATKFRSLVAHNEQPGLATEGATTAHMNNIAWSASGVPAPAERDPMNFFMTIVSAIPPSAGTAQSGPTQAVVAAAATRQTSILDHVMAEATALQMRVGSVDKARLEQHLTSLREVERILTTPSSATTTGAQCMPIMGPAAAEAMDVTLRAQVFLRLIALAFRCDLTRYASFALTNGFDSRVYPDITTLTNHHQITHTGKYGPNPPTIEMAFITRFTGLLAYLLNELKSTPEGAGTLLDNCLIYYGSEMSEGWHVADSMPVVLCGKAGGQVMTGRHLVYPAGTPLAQLFLSILQLAGSETKAFGLDTTGMTNMTPLASLAG